MNAINARPSRLSSLLLAAILALSGSAALLVTVNEAQARQRSAVITGPEGGVSQRNVSHTQGNATSTTTGPNGNSASRVTTRTATGSQTTLTGPRGQTGSVDVTRP